MRYYIYYKFVSDKIILNDEQTEVAKNNWSKYLKVNQKNTHYISYLMKKYFSGSAEIKYNQYNKPVIENGFFNISHYHNLCVGVFDRHHDIGIDVIHLERKIHQKFEKKIFNDSESKDIRQFSRKEAYLKMIGKGVLTSVRLLDIKIVDGIIYYKGNPEPYNIFETILGSYFICIVGTFHPTTTLFKLKEFNDAAIDDVI
jgi:hypothetical protein